MSERLELTDNDALRLLRSLSLMHEPITLRRSTEGGEHIVWIVNNCLVLRVPYFQEADPHGLAREKAVTDFLRHSIGNDALARAIPEVFTVGLSHVDTQTWRYATYQVASGVSIEENPVAVSSSTEEDLVQFLCSMSSVSCDQATNLGVTWAEIPAVDDHAVEATDAWDRLAARDMIPDLAGRDRGWLLRPPTKQDLQDDKDSWVLSHHDLKGEHIFVDPATGRMTSVIDWSDMRWAHPGIDIWGLAITVGAVAAARIAQLAGRSPSSIRTGLFLARHDSLIILDAIVDKQCNAPEWLVRRQLKRAMEEVEI